VAMDEKQLPSSKSLLNSNGGMDKDWEQVILWPKKKIDRKIKIASGWINLCIVQYSIMTRWFMSPWGKIHRRELRLGLST
jgi:hypothetical protein